MTTLPLIGGDGQLTVARSTNHGATWRAYCQLDSNPINQQIYFTKNSGDTMKHPTRQQN